MTTPKQSITEQIVELVRENKEDIEREKFNVIEIVVQGGEVDGLRMKTYRKRKKC